jgi:hypothetical protein
LNLRLSAGHLAVYDLPAHYQQPARRPINLRREAFDPLRLHQSGDLAYRPALPLAAAIIDPPTYTFGESLDDAVANLRSSLDEYFEWLKSQGMLWAAALSPIAIVFGRP